ncbi:MAG: hypothetical protein ABF315_03165, partial [Lentimonas sp.]
NVRGDLIVDGFRANFEYAEEVRVPTPDQPNEATNKAYVDNADLTLQESIADEASARINAINGITSGDTAFTGSPVFSAVNYSSWTDVSNNINGFVEASNVPSLSTVDVGGLLNAEVLNAEKLLRVGSTEITYDGGLRTSSIDVIDLRTSRIEVIGEFGITRFDGVGRQSCSESLQML